MTIDQELGTLLGTWSVGGGGNGRRRRGGGQTCRDGCETLDDTQKMSMDDISKVFNQQQITFEFLTTSSITGRRP